MKTVKLDPTNPPRFSKEEAARLDAMTDKDLGAAAESDPDNQPMTDDELCRMESVRTTKAARAATGLSQDSFARKYQLSLGRVRDLEQGRFAADVPLIYFLRRIERDPAFVRGELISHFWE